MEHELARHRLVGSERVTLNGSAVLKLQGHELVLGVEGGRWEARGSFWVSMIERSVIVCYGDV